MSNTTASSEPTNDAARIPTTANSISSAAESMSRLKQSQSFSIGGFCYESSLTVRNYGWASASDLIARAEDIQTTWGPSEANAFLNCSDEEARIRTAVRGLLKAK